MPLSSILEILCKWLFLLSALAMGISSVYKDKLPPPEYYQLDDLQAPLQSKTAAEPFEVEAGGQHYRINPLYAYQLDGVVVSLHNADDFIDIWHHKNWQDFLNLRDLCVVWGSNVANGVYRRIEFSNDNWTCWASWKDDETGRMFKSNALSNNHLLTEHAAVAKALLSAEPGDHIRLQGLLAEYTNPGNGFRRGTSTTRDDRGNGACETIYLNEFSIVNKAHPRLRKFYSFAKGATIVFGIGFVVMFMIAPVRVKP